MKNVTIGLLLSTGLWLTGCRSTPPVFLNDQAKPGSVSNFYEDNSAQTTREYQGYKQLGQANSPYQAQVVGRNVQPVSYVQDQEGSPSDLPLIQPGRDAPSPYEAGADEYLLTSLEQFEQAAREASPAVAELTAEIESLQGKLIQAGLPPNPQVGLMGSDINESGGAGWYGVFFGREIVRGNKLPLAQQAVCAEVEAMQRRLSIVEQQIVTDVRQRYYDLLVAQETVAITKELVQISQRAVDTSQKLFEGQEAAKTAVLQSELELENAKVVQNQAENQELAARRKLAGLLGKSDLETAEIEGDPRQLVKVEEFETSFDQLVNSSPEIQQLFAEVEQRRRRLARECVEPIPNVTWQANLLYDTLGERPVVGFQIGIPIPTLNQNQGAIRQAEQQVVAAERRAEKKALELRQRLASAYEAYLNAKLQIDAYEKQIIPKAKETLDLVNTGYEQGEIDFLQLLTAQRTYSQLNLTYLRQLQQVWRQNVEIRGLLLKGSFQ